LVLGINLQNLGGVFNEHIAIFKNNTEFKYVLKVLMFTSQPVQNHA